MSAHGGYPGKVVVRRGHTLADCDAELRASAEYNPFRGQPQEWTCSCGRRFEHVEDEAEGDFWAPVGAAS